MGRTVPVVCAFVVAAILAGCLAVVDGGVGSTAEEGAVVEESTDVEKEIVNLAEALAAGETNVALTDCVAVGDVVVEGGEAFSLSLSSGSAFIGTVNVADGEASVAVGEGCTWSLSGDCSVTSLTNNGVIQYNGYSITLADGTVLSA